MTSSTQRFERIDNLTVVSASHHNTPSFITIPRTVLIRTQALFDAITACALHGNRFNNPADDGESPFLRLGVVRGAQKAPLRFSGLTSAVCVVARCHPIDIFNTRRFPASVPVFG
jgi:hypothetical protein